jgi:RNA polymerase sigma factor (sigma-70 family)
MDRDDRMTDRQLILEYCRTGSQEAFAAIVRAHLDLVYAAARRQVRDAHIAQDVTQAVFIILARKASQLTGRDSLAGWLIKTAHLAAKDAIKLESRRQRHERQAAVMLAQRREEQEAAMATEPQADAEQISPELDRALSRLNERDRDAITLKYLHGQSTAQTAATLGLSEPAAAKRITRALDRLRRMFADRGITASSALSLGVVLQQIPRDPAPAALVHTIATSSTAAGAAPPGGLAIARGVLHMMTWSKIKAAALVIVALAAATGAGVGTMKLAAAQPAEPAAPAPSATVQPPAAEAPLAPEGFVGRLKNGVSIEVVGLCKSPSKQQQWWVADGEPLGGVPPYEDIGATLIPDLSSQALEIAVKVNSAITGSQDSATVNWYLPHSGGMASGGLKGRNGRPVRDIGAVAFGWPTIGGDITLRANVAAGPWKTLTVCRTTGSQSESFGDTSILFSNAWETNGESHMVIAMVGVGNVDTRVLAVDNTGRQIPAMFRNRSSNEKAMVAEVSVRAPLASLKECQLQTRPFDQWIEIRGISSALNQTTAVKAVTSDDR